MLALQFQLLAFPFSSWLTPHLPLPVCWGTAELQMGIWHVQDCSVAGWSLSNPEGDGHKRLQQWKHWARLAKSCVEPGSSAWLGCVGLRECCFPLPPCSSGCHGRKDGACIRGAAGDPGVWDGLCPETGLPQLHISLGTHRCQTAKAGRKPFSRLMQLPKIWEAVMSCKRRAPQFCSAWYLLVVSCATDGSTSIPARVLGPPDAVWWEKLLRQSWDFFIPNPLLLASMVGSNSWVCP